MTPFWNHAKRDYSRKAMEAQQPRDYFAEPPPGGLTIRETAIIVFLVSLLIYFCGGTP